MSLLLTICWSLTTLSLAIWNWSRKKSVHPLVDGYPAIQQQEETALSEQIIELVEEGVVILDDSLTMIKANKSARKLLGTEDSLPPRLPSEDLLSIGRRIIVEQHEVEDVIELRTPSRRSVHVRGSYLPDIPGVVLLLRDISDDQKSQRIRRQFVMHASHELKTPIAGILLLAEAVSDASATDPERTRHFAASLLRESERLNRLVGDLLDLSRLEDPATIANSIADLAALAKSEISEVLPQASAKSIKVTASLDDEVLVRGDEGQLGLMIRNLLDNAVRYTQEGQISVGITTDAGEAILQISDTGIGIPLRDQARVFERFYRVDKGRSRDQGGTGLGLAIVKHVADLHGGHVSVASELGEGSTFTVTLPLNQERIQDDEWAPDEAV
jgi:two-component system phosphate regulon sensor histidine kinase PhoR